MKTKDGEFIKRNGKWYKLQGWLKRWREHKSRVTPSKGAKAAPGATVKV